MTSIRAALFIPVTIALMVGIFILDSLTPLGVAVWVLYVVPTMLTYWSARPRSVLFVTVAVTVLMFVGHLLSPPGVAPGLALLNRCLGAGMLWFITAILVKHHLNTAFRKQTEATQLTVQKEHERELARLTRLYSALSHINQAIVWLPTRDELFQTVCHILVEHGGFQTAWIGWHDPETHQLVPLAVYGDENGYIRSIKVYSDERPGGDGPSGLAFRAGRPYVCNDIPNDPVTWLWRPELLRHGFQGCAVFPLRLNKEV